MIQIINNTRGADLASDALARCDRDPAHRIGFPTGFDLLDREIGQLRLHDLCVIGGRPGAGKTIVALQWARRMASDGHAVAYVCYEHDERELLSRLLTYELGMLDVPILPHEATERLMLINAVRAGEWSSAHGASRHPLVRAARANLEAYADRLAFAAGSAAPTMPELVRLTEQHLPDGGILFIDYVQKIPTPNVRGSAHDDGACPALKAASLAHPVAIVALSSLTDVGLASRRVRLHHLDNSRTIAYEADVVIMLNDKASAVSNVHLSFDPSNAERFKRRTVFSVEKNRHGASSVHLEYEKDFLTHRFSGAGEHVLERLVDDVGPGLD